jgi:hypothetical protein
LTVVAAKAVTPSIRAPSMMRLQNIDFIGFLFLSLPKS